MLQHVLKFSLRSGVGVTVKPVGYESFSKVNVRMRHQGPAWVTLLNSITEFYEDCLSDSVKTDFRLDTENISQNIRPSFQYFLKYETLEIEMIAYGNLFL